MNKAFTILVLFTILSVNSFSQVGIGTTTPDTSAMLDVSAVRKGLLIPRITSAARAGIARPATGLLVFQTDGTAGFYYYTGVAWLNLASGLTPDTSGYANPSSYGSVSTFASFIGPGGLAVDASGNVYVAATNNNQILKITPAGVVTTLAGSGAFGSADGTGAAASFYFPIGLAVDGSGNVYVADFFNYKIRKITSAGVVTTLAGSESQGSADGTGAAASFNFPRGVAVDVGGNVYVADYNNHKIRKITPAGVVTTLAGSGTYGSTDATGAAASFNRPAGVAVDAGGNVFVADQYNHKIRKVTPAGVVTTLAGSGSIGSTDSTGTAASFNFPNGVAVDAGGNVYVADKNNNKIRKITQAGVVTTLAGSGSQGATDGTGAAASFGSPTEVAIDAGGNVFVADPDNYKIRKIVTAADYVTKTNLSTALNNYATTASLSGYTTFANSQSLVHDSLSSYVSVSAAQLISGAKTFSSNLTANGNIGIGTNAPYSKLSNTVLNTIGSDGSGGNPGSFSWAATQQGYVGQFYNGDSVGGNKNGLVVKVASPGSTALDVSQGTTQNVPGHSLLIVKSGGNVGIGTSSPAQKLDVNGTVNATAFTGNGSALGSVVNTTTDQTISGAKTFSSNLIANGNIGIGTNAPYSKLSNTVLNTIGSDFSGGNPGSFSWAASQEGYVGQFYNGDAGGSTRNGLAVKVASTNATALDVSQGSSQTVAGSPLLTVKSGGNVGIGTNQPADKLNIIPTMSGGLTIGSITTGKTQLHAGISADAAGYSFLQSVKSEGSAWGDIIINKDGGKVGIGTISPDQMLTVNGNASKPGGGSWATFSDVRLKKNIQDYRKGLKEILAIHPVSFQYNQISGYTDQSKTYVGIVAQEIEKILPSTVSSINTDKQVKNKLQYDGSELTYTLINAIKEQQEEIKKLKQKLIKQQDFAKQLKQLQAWVLRQNEAGKATAGK